MYVDLFAYKQFFDYLCIQKFEIVFFSVVVANNNFQLYTYTSDMDYEEFYKNWIPKQCLPSDFGGDLPTVAEMHANSRKEFDDLRDYFLAEEDQRNNNAKNGNDSVKISEIKSLKIQKLEID